MPSYSLPDLGLLVMYLLFQSMVQKGLRHMGHTYNRILRNKEEKKKNKSIMKRRNSDTPNPSKGLVQNRAPNLAELPGSQSKRGNVKGSITHQTSAPGDTHSPKP